MSAKRRAIVSGHPNPERVALASRAARRCCWPECNDDGWDEAKLPLCPRHAARVHLNVSDMIPAASVDALKADRQELWYAREGSLYIATVGDLYKIGFTRDIAQRMRSLGGRLIASRPGTLDDERDLHAEFRAHRVHGEYFEQCEPIRARAAEWLDTRPPDSAESRSEQ